MARYAIIRMEKFKISDVQGIQKHNQRQGKSKSNLDIDYERSDLNYDLLNDQNLQYMFINTIKTKVIGKSAIALGVSLPAIANYINYAVDPAGKMADYLDSRDSKPNNGYLDVIW